MISRDFLHVYIWDIRNDSRPVAVFSVNDHLQHHLSDLYEFDALFDSFKLDASPDGLQLLTGSYNNNFSIHNWTTGSTLTFESGSRIPRHKNKTPIQNQVAGQPQQGVAGQGAAAGAGQGGVGAAAGKKKKGPEGSSGNQTHPEDAQSDSQSGSAPGAGSGNNATGPVMLAPVGGKRGEAGENFNIGLVNFNRKIINNAWHPSLDCVAVAGVNKLYIYQAFVPQMDDLL